MTATNFVTSLDDGELRCLIESRLAGTTPDAGTRPERLAGMAPELTAKFRHLLPVEPHRTPRKFCGLYYSIGGHCLFYSPLTALLKHNYHVLSFSVEETRYLSRFDPAMKGSTFKNTTVS